MDREGRINTLELEDTICQVLSPNADDQLCAWRTAEAWDRAYADYLAGLDQNKPVIAMGDFNVAHKESTT